MQKINIKKIKIKPLQNLKKILVFFFLFFFFAMNFPGLGWGFLRHMG